MCSYFIEPTSKAPSGTKASFPKGPAYSVKTGSQVGKLTVLDACYNSDDYRRTFALVKCECGTPPKQVLVTNLKQGRTLSCGYCTERGGARTRQLKPR